MSHLEIDIFLRGGVMEKLYLKPEEGEAIDIKDIFPKYLDIKSWYMKVAN